MLQQYIKVSTTVWALEKKNLNRFVKYLQPFCTQQSPLEYK